MATRVRSYSKVNLGLAIGAPRPDGFHALATLYQTLALHDVVTVSGRPAWRTRIQLSSNDPRVPRDGRNTVWKMVERVLDSLGRTAEVEVQIQKNLPIQGGMGAGSANAAAALVGLERELGLSLGQERRLELAAAVGSDVPLFLVGGAVLGTDRGQRVRPVATVTLGGLAEIPCVVALPHVGVSTPQAFRDWDQRWAGGGSQGGAEAARLHSLRIRDTMKELSRTYASVFPEGEADGRSGSSGIFPDPSSAQRSEPRLMDDRNGPEKRHGHSSEQLHASLDVGDRSGFENDLAENTLLALVRTGIENDFESVVFLQHPFLREIKRELMGSSDGDGNDAMYAALSGSGSALFGLYRTETAAQAAQQRLQQHGVQAIVTSTMPRPLYWSKMFAE